MHNAESIQENETYLILWDFRIPLDYLISARRLNLEIVIKKQTTERIVDFAVSTDHRAKLKEGEKSDKYLDLAIELKKLWKMKEIPTVIGSVVTKGLVRKLEELEIRTLEKDIQITALLWSTRILRTVLVI